MMVTPFHSPARVKRRFTPPKPASAVRIASSGIFSSCATATADVALSALCRPGIGNVRSLRVWTVLPSRSRNSTVNVWRPPALLRLVGRTSACGFLPIGGPPLSLLVLAVGDDAPVFDTADHALHDRMIGAHHGEAVERHV